MYRLINALALIVTFTASFGLATLRSHRRTLGSPVTFECDNVRTGFRTHYHSSDGQGLLYGCYEDSSIAETERYFSDEIRPHYKRIRWPDGHETEVQLVQQSVTYDATGNKTGERAVLDNGQVFWTEGARFHVISAPSVEYALLFEDSRAWAWEGCWKFLLRINSN
jgi:hypothetical protein